jgi:putative ABC transport system permease protein
MLMRRIRYWFRHARRARELRREIELHIEEKVADLRERGWSDPDAQTEARRQFGNVLQQLERSREVWISRYWIDFWQDARYGLRMLARSLNFSVITILTIAIATGTGIAIFGLSDALLFDNLPVHHPDELVAVRPSENGSDLGLFFEKSEYDQLQTLATNSIQLFASNFISPTLSNGYDVRQIFGMAVEGRYFNLLGIPAQHGRMITPDDDRDGVEPVTVLSDAFWKLQFGSDPAIIGKMIVLNGNPFTVIGIAPAGFAGTSLLSRDTNVLVPLAFLRRLEPLRRTIFVVADGRLRSGVTLLQAEAALTSAYRGLPKRQRAEIRLEKNSQGQNPLRDRFRKPLYVLLAAVLLVC